MITLTASRFNSQVSIHKGSLIVDAKSMFDLMTLMAEKGTPLMIEAQGDDAADAIKALEQLFDSNFAPPSSA